MKVVICGAGNIGSSLVHFLSLNYNIIVIDTDPKALERIGSLYDVQTLCGSAADPGILDQAGFDAHTHVIAVTQWDEINLVACHLSRMFGHVATTMARLENPAYVQKAFSGPVAHHFQLDMAFSAHDFSSQAILSGLDYPYAFDALTMAEGKMMLLGMRIPPLHPWVGQSVDQIQAGHDSYWALARLMRGSNAWIPNPSDVISPHDAAYIVVDADQVNRLYDVWKGSPSTEAYMPLQSVCFLGSSPVLFSVLPHVLARGLGACLLSENEDDLLAVSQKFPSVRLVKGSCVDPELIQSVLGTGCCTLSMGPDDRSNMLSAVMAHDGGAMHGMACIQNRAYLSPMCVRTIGHMVHSAPRILMHILQKINQSSLAIVYPLQGLSSGTILQATVRPGAKMAGALWADWQDERVRILALYRDQTWLWNPESLLVGDCVIATALPDGYDVFQRAFLTADA